MFRALLLSLFTVAVFAAEPRQLLEREPSKEDMARAREILAQWEKTDAEPGKRVMRVCYWTPADRDPQPQYRERLTRVMKHIQNFYAREMSAWGFGPRTIQLDLDPATGLLNIPVVKGTLKSDECSETDSADGQMIKRDCHAKLKEAGIDGSKETVVIFCNLADWDPVKREMSHHSPYYAGGDSRGGTAWQVDSPLLDSDSLGVKDQHLKDRQYGNISLGKYNSIFVGGVCHELGHALGLPHCRETAAEKAVRGTALMGSGNRTYGEELRGESKGSFLTLPHALKLAAHPQFSGSVKKMSERLKAEFSGIEFSSSEAGLTVRGKVAGNLPMYAVLAYADPDGGGDYDATPAAAIPAADGSFVVHIARSQKKNTTGLINLVAVATNGAASAGISSKSGKSFPCKIDANGGYEVAAPTPEKPAAN